MDCLATYAKDLQFSLVKRDGVVIGFSIASVGPESCGAKTFCLNIMSLLRHGRVKFFVLSEGSSVVVYNPENIGKSLIRFPVEKRKDLERVREIIFSEKVIAKVKVSHGDPCCFEVAIP